MNKALTVSIILLSLCCILNAVEPDTAFNNQFRKPIGGWIAADATYSIYLPDGRTLWLFGDTFIGETEDIKIIPGSKFIRNSAVIQEGASLKTLYSGTEQNPNDWILTPTPDSNWYWPEHGIVENDTLRIFLAKFKHIENGSSGFNFAHDGNDIANFTYPELGFISTVPILAHPQNHVFYGDRILEDSTFLYIYGRKSDSSRYNMPFPHLARTTKGNLMNQNSWEFYDGTDWSSDPSATKNINNFQVSQQYSITTYKGKYILLTQDTWLSPNIYSFNSDKPTGPWKEKTLLYKTPETSGSTFTYNAYAHPQFNKNGELLISYNLNGDFWSIFNNVELYRPQFIRVSYMNLSYEFWPNSNNLSSKPNSISVYPNPAREFVNVQFSQTPDGKVSWQILDLNGSIRLTQTLNSHFSSNQLQIPLTELEPGVFLLKIQSSDSTKILRIIKSN